MPQLRLEGERPVSIEQWTLDPVAEEIASANVYARLKPGPGRSAAEVSSHQRSRINRAMIEVAASHGYGQATIREIASVASISTRAFYQNYSGKEECFLRTHCLLVGRLLRRMEEAEADAGGGSTRLEAAVGAIVEEWGRDPQLARFFLIAPHGAGPAALAQSRLAGRSLAAQLAAGFADGLESEASRAHRLISVGVFAGLSSVARALIVNGRGRDLLEFRDDLARWTSSYRSHPATELEALDAAGQSERWCESFQTSSSKPEQGGRAASSSGDAALLHSAVVKLAASGDRDKLTVHGICAAAGVSRTCFEAHFSDLEDCLAVIERRYAGAAWDQAFWVAETAPPGTARVQRGLTSLCNQVARDPALANLCFGELIASGEWLARRERQHVYRLAELFDMAAPITGSKRRSIALDAALGAAVGLIGNTVNEGPPGSICRRGPLIGYLTLAPLIGSSSAIDVVREESGLSELAQVS